MPVSRAWQRAIAAVAPTGAIHFVAQATAPAGWVLANGGTIGSAASGASRANDDTADLYAVLWALDATTYPVLTSAGGASTRGASAAADFAANKRITLPDLRGEFIRGADAGRGVDASRVLGTAQAAAIGPHAHNTNGSTTRNTTAGGSDQVTMSSGGATLTNNILQAGTNIGSETRPRNVAMTAIVKL